jgi:hypothetical protein
MNCNYPHKLQHQKARTQKIEKMNSLKTSHTGTTIVEKHNAILVTESDKKILFDSLMNPPKPNKFLKNAAKQYQKQVLAR